MNPGWSQGFLELSESYDININELHDSVSYSRAAGPVPHYLLHNSGKGQEREKKLFILRY